LPVSFISLRFERVDNLGAYRIPPETGILIPSGFVSYRVHSFCQHLAGVQVRDSGEIFCIDFD
jgi:hypothetical protein